jgi:hypothetical protein
LPVVGIHSDCANRLIAQLSRCEPQASEFLWI